MPKPFPRVADPASGAGFGPPGPSFQTRLAEVVDAAFAAAACLTRSPELAARLLQETAVAAYREFGPGIPAGDFRVRFLALLVRGYVALRSAGAIAVPEEADLDDTPDLYLFARLAGAGALEDGPDPAAALFDRLGPDRLMLALDRLPEEYRLVTVLYYLEDLSYEALAEITRQPVGAVRARLHRGRKMLQRAIWEVAGGKDVAAGGGETGP